MFNSAYWMFGQSSGNILALDSDHVYGLKIYGKSLVKSHVHKNFPATSEGYFNRLNIIQNVSAVTGALLMTRREVYESLGGFDEDAFGVAYNDVDYCLRARERGLLNVFTPYVEAYHHESISRGYEDTPEKQQRFQVEMTNLLERHGEYFRGGDPYYNPNLDQGRDDFGLPAA